MLFNSLIQIKIEYECRLHCSDIIAYHRIITFIGTVGVITSELLFVDWCVPFTTVPFKPLTGQGCRTYPH